MIDAQVNDPFGWIVGVQVAGESEGYPMVVIRWRGDDPVAAVERKPLGAVVTLKEGTGRQKATVTLSGLPFPPRTLPRRLVVITGYAAPSAPSDPSTS